MDKETEHLLKARATTPPNLNSEVQMIPVNLASARDAELLMEFLISIIETEVVLHDLKFTSEKSVWIAFQPLYNSNTGLNEEAQKPRKIRKMRTRLIQLKLQVAKYLWKVTH